MIRVYLLVAQCTQTLYSHKSSVTTSFGSSERKLTDVEHREIVHCNSNSLDTVDDLFDVLFIASKHCTSETVDCRVCDINCFIDRVNLHQKRDGRESFFLSDLHVFRDVNEQGWLEIVTVRILGMVITTSPVDQSRPFFHRRLDQPFQMIESL